MVSASSAPLVSVLMPCRNVATTLHAAMESLFGQTLSSFECICVDDGSTDATPDVLRKYQELDPRIVVLHQRAEGIVAALNNGLARTRGQYVARMDADDIAMLRRLELQADLLSDNPQVGLVGSRVVFGGSIAHSLGYSLYVDWTNSLITPNDLSLHRFVESPFAHPSIMFRRELINRHGPYRPGPFPEDYELILRWMEAGVVMAKVDQPLLVWNDPLDRLSRTDPRYAPEAFYRMKAGYLARWLASNNPRHPAVILMGAGRTTRRRAHLLDPYGIEITSYVDIDPHKVGRSVNGRPVLHREELPGPDTSFCLSFVASRGAREEISRFLVQKGYTLGKDFILAA